MIQESLSAATQTVPLQSTTEQATAVATQLLGLALFAGTLAAVVALFYRWVSREQIPVALALLVGLSAVAVYLNTTTVLGSVIAGETTLSTDVTRALFNIGAFLAGGAGSVAGLRAGDRFSTDVFLDAGTSDVDDDVNRLVRTVGRVTVVTLPEEIDDVVGYDPVSQEAKEKLAGKRFLFPHGLTVGALQSRLTARLKSDYGVGTVDLELTDGGMVEYLAVGSRAAGIGPTLPPATNAVAVKADPAFAASAGDIVQVWETDPMRRVLTAELRGVADDVVTIAIDAADTPKIDPRQQYRLVTLPVEDRPEREFASLLRAADETFSTVTVEAGSPLHGMPAGALDLTIVALKPEDEGELPIPLPEDTQRLTPGDTVFAIGRPEALRRLETAGQPLDPGLVSDVGTPSVGGDSTTTQPPETAHSQPATASTPTQEEPADTSPEVGEPILDDEPEAPSSPADGTAAEGATADAGLDDEPVAAADTGGDQTGGDDGGSTFDELKAEFESGDADWEETDESDDEPVESVASGSTSSEPEDAEKSGGSSFDELKSEFESGDADWDQEESAADTEGSDAPESDDTDDLVGLEDADISFEDDEDDTFDIDDGGDDDLEFEDGGDESEEIGFDDGGSAFELDDEEGDDVLDLDLDDKEDDGLSLDDDEEEHKDEEDDDDDDDGGGGSTFAQLKEEFESGDADWEDDISDSPGGDMRLDE